MADDTKKLFTVGDFTRSVMYIYEVFLWKKVREKFIYCVSNGYVGGTYRTLASKPQQKGYHFVCLLINYQNLYM